MNQPTISFEFFPPKNDAMHQQLWDAMPELAALGPKYMTVTYGAAGSTKDGTLETITRAVQDYPDIPFACHLTFLSTPKEDLDDYIETLWDRGVKAIVALRGDLPKGTSYDDFQGEQYYTWTSEFVEMLKERHEFDIIVGAYPEKHPDAPTLDDDIEALKKKCAAGADSATTQFFFDNDVFYRFRDKCQAAGIETPINPGIIAIHDFKSLCGFAGKCQTSVPDWVHKRFEGLEDKPEEAKKVATDILTEQVQDLAANGISHIHFYPMNRSSITCDACEALGYMTKAA